MAHNGTPSFHYRGYKSQRYSGRNGQRPSEWVNDPGVGYIMKLRPVRKICLVHRVYDRCYLNGFPDAMLKAREAKPE